MELFVLPCYGDFCKQQLACTSVAASIFFANIDVTELQRKFGAFVRHVKEKSIIYMTTSNIVTPKTIRLIS